MCFCCCPCFRVRSHVCYEVFRSCAICVFFQTRTFLRWLRYNTVNQNSAKQDACRSKVWTLQAQPAPGDLKGVWLVLASPSLALLLPSTMSWLVLCCIPCHIPLQALSSISSGSNTCPAIVNTIARAVAVVIVTVAALGIAVVRPPHPSPHVLSCLVACKVYVRPLEAHFPPWIDSLSLQGGI